jgi:amidase
LPVSGTFQGKKGTGKEKEYESLIVKELKSLGAILFVKTSVPHTLMSGETVNNIIGYTENPKNRNLAAGGSSGGEGALIGLRGSPVGFGTVSNRNPNTFLASLMINTGYWRLHSHPVCI